MGLKLSAALVWKAYKQRATTLISRKFDIADLKNDLDTCGYQR